MSKLKTYKWRILSIIVVVILAILYWQLDIKFKKLEIDIGPSPEAKQNPYLAAKMLVEQMHGKDKFETQQGLSLLSKMPSNSDTMIIDSPRTTVTETRTQILVDWVERGGHLVVTGQVYNQNEENSTTDRYGDLLLQHFGFTIIRYTNPDSDENAVDEQASQAEKEAASSKIADGTKTIEQILVEQGKALSYACPEKPLMTQLTSAALGPAMSANIASDNIIAYDGPTDMINLSAHDGYGPQIMQLAVGQGKLTVMTDMRLWRNQELACFDNAFLLNALIKDSNKTWLLYDEDLPGLVTLLWRNSKTLILSCLLLIGLWIWSQTLRFGAIGQVDSRVRRSYLEHLSAAARYRWDSGDGDELIDLLRTQILHRLALRHQELGQMSEQQQANLIARLSDTDESQIVQVMFTPVPQKIDGAIKLVQQLQQLRKQLC